MKADGFQVVPLVYTFPGTHKRERERERIWKEGERGRNGNEVRKIAHVLSIMWWFERLAFFFFLRLLFPITVFFFSPLMTFPSSSPLFSSSFGTNHQEDRNSISLPSSCWFRSFLLRKRKRKSPQNSFSSFFRHSLLRRLSARSAISGTAQIKVSLWCL